MSEIHRTLIDARALYALTSLPHASGAKLVVLDCGIDQFDPAGGRRAYEAGHIPGAQYAHLEEDLSGPKSLRDGAFPGRHPLPDRDEFAATVGRFGITPETQVVAYDAQGGPYAARAWWLLRWLGHEAVAVLDGGSSAWLAAGHGLSRETPATQAAMPYPAGAPAMPTIDAAALQGRLGRVRLIDARAPERFRGDVEPLDAAAGHIPGALNRFFKDNLQADGRFKPPATLRGEWSALVANHPTTEVVQHCGSGVTACHNLLALAYAGFGDSVLYPGSWSEWSSDPSRPTAKG